MGPGEKGCHSKEQLLSLLCPPHATALQPRTVLRRASAPGNPPFSISFPPFILVTLKQNRDEGLVPPLELVSGVP